MFCKTKCYTTNAKLLKRNAVELMHVLAIQFLSAIQFAIRFAIQFLAIELLLFTSTAYGYDLSVVFVALCLHSYTAQISFTRSVPVSLHSFTAQISFSRLIDV
jgi:hypothetical protein